VQVASWCQPVYAQTPTPYGAIHGTQRGTDVRAAAQVTSGSRNRTKKGTSAPTVPPIAAPDEIQQCQLSAEFAAWPPRNSRARFRGSPV
jgi:hypothetical protein